MLCSVIYRGRFGWEGGRVGARELLFPPFVFSKLRKILTSHLQGAGGQGRVGGGGGGGVGLCHNPFGPSQVCEFSGSALIKHTLKK